MVNNEAGGDGQARGEQREGQPRNSERQDRDRGPRRGKGGKPFGKGGDRDRGGRGDRRDNKPAPKLYSFESVVDRGYEDVAPPPPAEGEAPVEGGTRRVDWQIVKRTLADQRAAKTVSAQYILKRDGAEMEFPNLGAARAAVNKTIVHPEKLTRAKRIIPRRRSDVRSRCVTRSYFPITSCPALCPASTSLLLRQRRGWPGQARP